MATTPGWFAQLASLGNAKLVARQLPSPLLSSTGTVDQSLPGRMEAIPVLPSALKLPGMATTPCWFAQLASLGNAKLVARQLPSPLLNSTGTVDHQPLRMNAMSDLPSPS